MIRMQAVLLVCVCAAAFLTACATQQSYTSESGVSGINRNDPYMYPVCTYFKEVNARWPTNTSELVLFLHANYTNMVEEIQQNYARTTYKVSPEGWLILETNLGRGEEKKWVR